MNVWATWCHPCVEELARVYRFRDRLATEGAPADVLLLSVDAGDEDVARFATEHREAHGSVRISDVHALPQLIAGLGLDPGASIPIHAFVDPAGKLRCVRTGAVEDADYDAVKAVLTQR